MRAPSASPPPRDLAELRARATSLRGATLADIALSLGRAAPPGGAHAKGKVGELIERALGASAGNASIPDFPELEVELKTIPLGPRGVPRESTFVCAVSVVDADRAEWETSPCRAKLAHVLWVPLLDAPDDAGRNDPGARRVGQPVLWRPTTAQEQILRGDFEDLMGLIGIGGIEAVTAHAGRWLQLRPKAATGRARTLAHGPDGERLATVPRGFYLRPAFTGGILRDPAATP